MKLHIKIIKKNSIPLVMAVNVEDTSSL